MIARILRRTLILMVLASVARAVAVSPPGVNVRWDNCFGDAGVWNKTFACDTNTGSERLVCSLELDQAVTGVAGIEFRVDVSSASASLPAWWQVRNAGTCRSTSLNLTTLLPPGSVNCADWSAGAAAGGIGLYQVGNAGPASAKLLCALAVPPSALATLSGGQEYYFASLTLNHLKTVGTGSCAGCDTPVCIFLSYATLTFPVFGGNIYIDRGANYLGSQYASWQNGYPIDVHRICEVPTVTCRTRYTTANCVPYDVTRSTTSTWGSGKSLYR